MSDKDDNEQEESSEDDDDLPPLGGDREMKSFRRAWRIDEYVKHEPHRKKVVMTDKYSHDVIRVRRSAKKPMKRKKGKKRTTRGNKKHKKG